MAAFLGTTLVATGSCLSGSRLSSWSLSSYRLFEGGRNARAASATGEWGRSFMHGKDFLRMFSYDHWANRGCLIAMRQATNTAPDVIGRMAHILSAQKLWLERILQHNQSMPVWPSSTIEDCLALADEMSAAWRSYLTRVANQFAPGSLDDEVEYKNSKGEPWSSRVEDILMHVLFHSAYHRGQIALQLSLIHISEPTRRTPIS